MDEKLAGPKIAVIGIGNILLKDDGIGVHVVNHLRGMVDINSIEIIDGGTVPDIVSLISDSVEHLIVIDAANGGDMPGTIYRFRLDDIDACSGFSASIHDISLVHTLKMMELLDRRFKSVSILGIEPSEIDFGLEPTPVLAEKIPKLIDIILEDIDKVNKSMEVKK